MPPVGEVNSPLHEAKLTPYHFLTRRSPLGLAGCARPAPRRPNITQNHCLDKATAAACPIRIDYERPPEGCRG